ncbi:MAG: hypothetical protein N2200_04960 [Bacteroidia bacterium]|nr:hypothetical protein [Bacteroidia bacterium]
MLDFILDLVIGLFVLLTAYFLIVYPLRSSPSLPIHLRKIAFWAWLAKVAGAFTTYYLYLLYYGGGDIINYISDSVNFVKLFFWRPIQTLEYIFSSIINRDYFKYLNENADFSWFLADNGIQLIYLRDPVTQTVGALTFPITLLSLGSVNGTIVLFATYSFWVSFGFFRSLEKVYPTSWQSTAIPILFLPSVVSWIALPFKEAYALLFTLYALRRLFLEQPHLLQYLLSFILIYLAYVIKPYIVMSFIPILGFMIIQVFGKKMKSDIFLYALYLILVVLILGLTLYLIQVSAESSGKYALENIPKQAYLVQMDLVRNTAYYAETGGSVYDIGEFEPTMTGMLSKFPIAFFTGLFRPFLWEAKKGIVFLAALEGTSLLFFTLYGLFKYSPQNVLRSIFSHHMSRSFIIFSIVFLFMVGLTSGNFGNLVRYRVPGIFFFYLVIFANYAELRAKANHHRGGQ